MEGTDRRGALGRRPRCDCCWLLLRCCCGGGRLLVAAAVEAAQAEPLPLGWQIHEEGRHACTGAAARTGIAETQWQ